MTLYRNAWHYHKAAGDMTVIRPSQPGWSTHSGTRHSGRVAWWRLATLRPLCKTKGYELYLTACVLHVSCRRCLHLMEASR